MTLKSIFSKGRIAGAGALACFCMYLSILILSGCQSVEPKLAPLTGEAFRSQAFGALAAIREEKKRQLVGYFEQVRRKAEAATDDEALLAIFLEREGGPSRFDLDEKYVRDYSEFYDILLADEGGNIFNSVRKEPDYRENIFADNFPLRLDTNLSRKALSFVDYQDYRPSKEVASFFFLPVNDQGAFKGWVIFQFPLNSLNIILSKRSNLGRTGEIYLVNSDMLLLSESRFLNEVSPLRLKVDTDAVRQALKHQRAERITTDYRGVRVYSSFERFDFLGASWVILAEMDESEILTDAFVRHQAAGKYDGILDRQKMREIPPASAQSSRPDGVVEMGEFLRAEQGTKLGTFGVATYAAVAIQFRDRFAYLAHIPPTDEVYGSTGEGAQNMLAELLVRIGYFELLPVEKRQVEFLVVAPHATSLPGIVETILENGFDIGNIRLAINPLARGANLSLEPFERIQIQWYGGSALVQEGLSLPTLQDLFADLLNYPMS